MMAARYSGRVSFFDEAADFGEIQPLDLTLAPLVAAGADLRRENATKIGARVEFEYGVCPPPLDISGAVNITRGRGG